MWDAFFFHVLRIPSMFFLAIITESSARFRLFQQVESCIVLQKCFTLKICWPNIGCWQLPTNSLCCSNALRTWDIHPWVRAASYSLGSEGNMGIHWQRRGWAKAVSKWAFRKRHAFLWVLKAAFLAWKLSRLTYTSRSMKGRQETDLQDRFKHLLTS